MTSPTASHPPPIPRSRRLGWPQTEEGRRAAVVSGVVLVLFLIDASLAAVQAYDWGFPATLLLGITGVASIFGALASLVLSIRALRRGDRSIVLMWPLLLGGFAVVFLLGEFLAPH